MNDTQKVVLVTTASSGTQGLSSVNKDLREGWRVVEIAPMGGAGGGEGPRFAALVVLEQSGPKADGMLEQVEEEAAVDLEEQIEEALEGGYTVESSPEPNGGGWKNPGLE